DDGAAGLVFDPALQMCVPGSSRHVNEISADPYVTSVGGTEFQPDYDSSGNDSGFVAEQVWDEPLPISDPDYPGGATGGGISAVFAKPAYQQGVTPTDGKREDRKTSCR